MRRSSVTPSHTLSTRSARLSPRSTSSTPLSVLAAPSTASARKQLNSTYGHPVTNIATHRTGQELQTPTVSSFSTPHKASLHPAVVHSHPALTPPSHGHRVKTLDDSWLVTHVTAPLLYSSADSRLYHYAIIFHIVRLGHSWYSLISGQRLLRLLRALRRCQDSGNWVRDSDCGSAEEEI